MVHATRRQLLTLLGGAAAGWPIAARAQQPSARVWRIAAFTSLAPDDAEMMRRNAAFEQTLQELGWKVGHNITIEYRYGAGDHERMRKHAAELAALAPDVIFVVGGATEYMLRATRTVPIVFAGIADAIGGGFAESLTRPGRNATGFTNSEYSMSGKWLELLKEIAPHVTRVGALRDTISASAVAQFAVLQAVAPFLKIELTPLGMDDESEIARHVMRFAREPNAGLIAVPTALAIVHRKLIIALAARHKLPAAYGFSYFVTDGGLISYGPEVIEPYRRAAGYVDRILKGEKPADLPVQAPTKYELAINLKTAKSLGLEVPTALLARADEVIE
jgi:putative ABC transport system substrate-binding protein